MRTPLTLPPGLSNRTPALDQDRLTGEKPAPATISLRELLIFSIVAGLLATLLRSYRYGFDNHLEQLPLIFRAMDDSYLAGDYFVTAGSAYGPRTYYSALMASLGSVIPLPVVFLLLTCGAHILTTFVTCLMGRTMFRGNGLAPLLGAVFVMGVDSIAIGQASSLRSWHLTPQTLAMPAALMAFWCGFMGRPLLCALLAAGAAFIHPTVGLQTGLIGLGTAGLATLLGLDDRRRTATARIFSLVMTALAMAGLLAYAYFVWIRPLAPADAESDVFSLYIRFRVPHHFIPSTFAVADWAALAAFLAALALSWKWWRADPGTHRPLAWRYLIPVGALLAILAGGYVFVEVWPSKLWTAAQVFRLVFLLKWLGLVLLGGTVARWLTAKPADGWTSGLITLLGTGVFQPFFMLAAHLIAGLGTILRSRFYGPGLNLLFVALLVPAIGAMKTLVDGGELRIMGLLVAIAVWFAVIPHKWPRVGLPVLATAALLAIVIINRLQPIPLLANGRVPILSELLAPDRHVITLDQGHAPGDAAAAFALANLPAEAVFLTPPQFGRFRCTARRAIVVDVISVTFAEEGIGEWYRRSIDCYGDVDGTGYAACRQWEEAYQTIPTERVLLAGRRYGATYAVLHAHTPTELPVVYADESYKIVGIPPAP